MLARGKQFLITGQRQLQGPLAIYWVLGLVGALIVKILGLTIGGWWSLLGLIALSTWLPAVAEHGSKWHWSFRQWRLIWWQQLLLAIIWLPTGWGGYLATLQVSVKVPAPLQNAIFQTRYDWLPYVVPIWGLLWLASFKWLPSFKQQLLHPTTWRAFWLRGWQTSWWHVVRRLWAAWQWVLGALIWMSVVTSITAVVTAWQPTVGWWVALGAMVSMQWGMCISLAAFAQREGFLAGGAPHRYHRYLMAGLAIVIVGFAGYWLRPTTSPAPAIIAHRGVNGRDGVQNTTKALKRTVKRTQPALVEMDIQPTADHHWVVMHDPTLMNLADKPGPVSDYRLQQIDGIKLHEHGQHGTLSTFKQYLQVATAVKQPLLVEIKVLGSAGDLMTPFASAYATSLEKTGGAVHSLDYQVVARLKQRTSKLRVGYITPFYLTDFTANAADFYSLQALTATPEQVNAAHRSGRAVYLWTVDRRIAMQRLSAMGVDGLITNHPGRLRQLQAHRNQRVTGQLLNWVIGLL